MLIKERKTDISVGRFGGSGECVICHYMDEALLHPAITMYAEVILKPGCSLGYHCHKGSSEILRILAGVGRYCEDGEELLLRPGDSAYCPEGHSHSIANPPEAAEDLRVQALVVKAPV